MLKAAQASQTGSSARLLFVVWGWRSGVVAVEHVGDLLLRRGGEEGDHDDGAQGAQEGGQQLIDVEDAADRGHQELPHKDHHAAHDQTGHDALAVAPPPEQGAQHGGAEGGAKARPGEGDDLEHVAVGVGGQEEE